MRSQDAILLIAHGSREPIANQEVIEMAKRLSDKRNGLRVIPCFLDVVSPSIPEGFEMAVKEGYNQLVVIPAFLNTGAHVKIDIPKIIQECKVKNPGIKVIMTPALGPDPELDTLVLKRYDQANNKHL